jgi:hypothetical protein
MNRRVANPISSPTIQLATKHVENLLGLSLDASSTLAVSTKLETFLARGARGTFLFIAELLPLDDVTVNKPDTPAKRKQVREIRRDWVSWHCFLLVVELIWGYKAKLL